MLFAVGNFRVDLPRHDDHLAGDHLLLIVAGTVAINVTHVALPPRATVNAAIWANFFRLQQLQILGRAAFLLRGVLGKQGEGSNHRSDEYSHLYIVQQLLRCMMNLSSECSDSPSSLCRCSLSRNGRTGHATRNSPRWSGSPTRWLPISCIVTDRLIAGKMLVLSSVEYDDTQDHGSYFSIYELKIFAGGQAAAALRARGRRGLHPVPIHGQEGARRHRRFRPQRPDGLRGPIYDTGSALIIYAWDPAAAAFKDVARFGEESSGSSSYEVGDGVIRITKCCRMAESGWNLSHYRNLQAHRAALGAGSRRSRPQGQIRR